MENERDMLVALEDSYLSLEDYIKNIAEPYYSQIPWEEMGKVRSEPLLQFATGSTSFFENVSKMPYWYAERKTSHQQPYWFIATRTSQQIRWMAHCAKVYPEP